VKIEKYKLQLTRSIRGAPYVLDVRIIDIHIFKKRKTKERKKKEKRKRMEPW